MYNLCRKTDSLGIVDRQLLTGSKGYLEMDQIPMALAPSVCGLIKDENKDKGRMEPIHDRYLLVWLKASWIPHYEKHL